MTIKIAIIDDDEYIREGVREVLEYEGDMSVCGEAKNLQEAREILRNGSPDIAIVDISIDGREGGLKFIQEMCRLKLATKAIVLSAHDESMYADRSLKEGAKGYICKDKIVQCLAAAVRDVQAGKEFISK